MIPKTKKLPRHISPGRKYDFIGSERARVRDILRSQEYDVLPRHESMRDYIWRGHNCWSDNTRFGFFYSRKIENSVITRILAFRIGDDFDSVYSDICHRFRGYDLEHVKYIVFGLIGRDKHRFGSHTGFDYGIESGVLVRVERSKTKTRGSNTSHDYIKARQFVVA